MPVNQSLATYVPLLSLILKISPNINRVGLKEGVKIYKEG